jgi:hypothetical protein
VRRAAAVAAVAGVALLAGCGGGDEQSALKQATTAPAEAEAAKAVDEALAEIDPVVFAALTPRGVEAYKRLGSAIRDGRVTAAEIDRVDADLGIIQREVEAVAEILP